MPTKISDPVSHPAHYNSGRIEVIEFIEDQGLNFSRGNAIKYTARAGKKDVATELEDLQKARWYLSREIELLEAARDEREVRRPNDMNPRKEKPVYGCSEHKQQFTDLGQYESHLAMLHRTGN